MYTNPVTTTVRSSEHVHIRKQSAQPHTMHTYAHEVLKKNFFNCQAWHMWSWQELSKFAWQMYYAGNLVQTSQCVKAAGPEI